MPYVFLAALVLLVVIVIVNWAANADAATIKRFGRYMGAFLMVAAAAFVAARGQFGIAGPILVAAYFVATGRGIPGLNRSKPAPGQSSQGLGHAVWCARHLVGDEPFAVLLADDLIYGARSCLAQKVDAQAQTGGSIVALMDVPQEHTSRYGIVTPGAVQDRLVEVKGLVEKPDPAEAPSNHAVVGRYILQPEIFDYLSAHEKGAGGEIQLTDAMAKTLDNSPMHGYRFEGVRYDCGDKVGHLQANIAIALDRPDLGPALRDALTPLLLDEEG